MSNKYIKMKKVKMAETSQIRNEKLNIPTVCPYCSRPSPLLTIFRHMKSKKCTEMKKLYLESEALKEERKTEFYIIKQINEAIQAHLHPSPCNELENEISYSKYAH